MDQCSKLEFTFPLVVGILPLEQHHRVICSQCLHSISLTSKRGRPKSSIVHLFKIFWWVCIPYGLKFPLLSMLPPSRRGWKSAHVFLLHLHYLFLPIPCDLLSPSSSGAYCTFVWLFLGSHIAFSLERLSVRLGPNILFFAFPRSSKWR